MADDKRPLAVVAAESPPRTRQSNYPEPFFTAWRSARSGRSATASA